MTELAAMPIADLTQRLSAIFIRSADPDVPIVAEPIERPGGVFYRAQMPDGPRFFRLNTRPDGWLDVVDVTEIYAPIWLDAVAVAEISFRKAAAKREARIAKSEQRHFELTHKPSAIEPTDATRKRLAPDTIATMVANKQLTGEQRAAAEDIRFAFNAVTAGLWSKACDMNAVARGSRGDMHSSAAYAWTHRYKPWADCLSGIRYQAPTLDELRAVFRTMSEDDLLWLLSRVSESQHGEANQDALMVTIAVVIDGCSLAEVTRRERWRDTKAAKLLKEALNRYAEMAGWLAKGNAMRRDATVAP